MNINPVCGAPALDLLLANANNGYGDVYSGVKPTDSKTAISGQTLLGTFRFAATAFGATSTTTGLAAVNAVTSFTALANGTPAFVRIRKSDGTTVFADYPAGVGSGEFNFPAVFSQNATISLASGTVGFPV